MKQISMMRPLHKGIQVLKLSSTGKLQKRILTLSADQLTLFVTHGKVSDSTKAALLPTPIYTPSKGFGKQDQGNYLRYIDVADLESFCVGVISTESLEGNIKPKMIPSVVTIFHQENFGLDLHPDQMNDYQNDLVILRYVLDDILLVYLLSFLPKIDKHLSSFDNPFQQ